MKKKIVLGKFGKIILRYIFSVIIFSCIYYFLWFYNPDYFIVDVEYNKQPLARIRDLVSGDMKPSKKSLYSKQYSLGNLSESVDVLENELYIVRDSISLIEKKETGNRHAVDSLSQIVRNDQQQRFDSLLNARLSPYLAMIDSLQKEIEKSEQKLTLLDSAYEKMETESSLARLKYNKSLIELKLSEDRYKMLNFYLYNSQIYINDSLYADFKKFYDLTSQLLSTKMNLWLSEGNIRSKMYSLWGEVYKYRYPSIDYFDCLYFSLTLSTTVNFGDIIPNNTFVRLIVIIQIIISFVFLGIIIDTIIKKLQTK